MLWAPPFKIEEATNNNGKSPSTFLETKDKGTLLSNSDTGAVVYFVNCEGTNCEIVAHGIVGTEKIEYLYCTENNMRVEDELKGLHIKQIWEPSTQKVIPINDDNVREKLWKAWTKKVADKLGFNRIIFGAPGTGKSYQLNKQAEYCFDADHMERVTFHPEYSYFDFVGSYKPVMEGKNIKYDFIPGPFARILVKALNDKEHPYLLLIEEINRARVAAVFGDIFQLLDRNESGESEYEIMPSLELARYLQNNPKLKNEEIKPIRIPNNLYIWATMNSADQGVYPLDTAFKRRWSMEYIPYNPPKGKILPDDKWNQIRTGINRLLLEKGHVNEDKLMGYYFLKKEERTSDKLKDALQNKVLMYLFDDAAKHCRKEIFKIEGKDVITFSALQNKMRAAMEQPIDPNSNLGVFSEELHQPDAGQ